MTRLRRKLRTWRRVVGLWIAGVDGRPVANVVNVQAEAFNPDTVAELLRQQAPNIAEIIARQRRRPTREVTLIGPSGAAFGRTEEPAL